MSAPVRRARSRTRSAAEPDHRLAPLADPGYLVPAVVAVLGVMAAALALAAPPAPAALFHDVRAVTTTVFLLVGPGWAVAGFLRGPLGQRIVVALGTGLALGIAAGQAMVVTGAWHPVGMLLALVTVSVPLLLRHAVRAA